MKRSRGRFLVFFVIAVAAGAGLIWLLPAGLGDDAALQSWIPPVLGAIFAASAFISWKVRPNWKQASHT
jgi:hypothetical protein